MNEKLQKGMTIFAANADNIAFAYGTYLRKTEWESSEQGILLDVVASHNFLSMPIVNGKLCTRDFDRYLIHTRYGFIANHQHSQLVETCLNLAKHLRIANIQHRNDDIRKIEIELHKLLSQVPEYDYLR